VNLLTYLLCLWLKSTLKSAVLTWLRARYVKYFGNSHLWSTRKVIRRTSISAIMLRCKQQHIIQSTVKKHFSQCSNLFLLHIEAGGLSFHCFSYPIVLLVNVAICYIFSLNTVVSICLGVTSQNKPIFCFRPYVQGGTLWDHSFLSYHANKQTNK